MKKLRPICLLLALVLCLQCLPIFANAADVIGSGYCGGEGDGTNLTWELTDDGTLTISGCGEMADYGRGNPWEELSEAVKNIVIGDQVTSIGICAFWNHKNVVSVEIPDSVTEIREYAFINCYSLESIDIPDGVKEIGYRAFYSCPGLTSVDLGRVEIIGEEAFYGADSLSYVHFPNTLTQIGKSAFEGSGLSQSLSLSENVQTVGERAFYDTELSEVYVNRSGLSIGKEAFYGSDVSAVWFSGDAPTVAENAFDEETTLYYISKYAGWTDKDAYDPENSTWNGYPLAIWEALEPIGYGYCGGEGDGTNLTWELDKNGVLTIDGSGAMADYAFMSGGPWLSYRHSIRQIIIGDEVTYIGVDAFSHCTSLHTITIGNGVTAIGMRAFYWMPELTKVIIGENVETIGMQAFASSSILTSVVVPESVKTIGSQAFQHVENVYFKGDAPANDGAVTWYTHHYLPWTTGWTDSDAYDPEKGTWNGRELKVWEEGEVIASGYCGGEGDGTNLTWTLDNRDVLTISGSGAMENYSNDEVVPWSDLRDNIRVILVGDEVTTVGTYAFVKCHRVIQVELGDSLTALNDNAFTSCTALTSLELPDSLTYIGEYALGNTPLTSLNIPDNVTTIDNWAFYWCKSLTSVTIGEGLTDLGGVAFYWCSNLTDVYFRGNAPTAGVAPFDETQATLYYLPRTNGWTDSDAYDPENSTWNGYPLAIWEKGETIASGYCGGEGDGTNLTWNLDNRDVLTISGSGAMEHYSGEDTPWYAYRADVVSVILENGVTSIGENAFSDHGALSDVYYLGAQEQWDTISIGNGNDALTNAELHHVQTVYAPDEIKTHTASIACTDHDTVFSSATEDCVDEDDNKTCDLCGASTIQKFDLAGSNMTLGNRLEVNFLFFKTDLIGTGYTAIVTQELADGTKRVKEIPMKDWGTLNSYHKVSIGVTAKEMADELTIEIVDANGNVYNNDYATSVRDYAHRALASDTATDRVKIMVVDMLNYGASAQMHFGYNKADLANSHLTEEQQAIATPSVACSNDQIKGTNFYGANLSLEDSIQLNVFFTGLRGKDMSKAKAGIFFTDYRGVSHEIEVPGTELKPQGSSGDMYRVVVDDIVLADAKQMVIVALYTDGGVFHGLGADSVESYIARAEAAGADTHGLYANIMKFATSAYNYITNR